jgi:heme-degrading monooxygenase HmoA
MIIRVFRARVQSGMANAFERMVQELSIPLVEAQKGLLARYSGKPVGSNADEFVMVSVWEDLASLQAFVGENWEEAIIPEEERPVLLETTVHHYESFGSARTY